MIEFIKKNKVFISSLSILLVAISFLSVQVLLKDANETPPNLQEPNYPDPIEPVEPVHPEPEGEPETPITHQPANVKSFMGKFHEQTNTIQLSWEINRNDSKIQKVELYNQDSFIADVTNNATYEVPINFYKITTGNNVFRLHITLENEDPVYTETSVFVDYILNVNKTHEFIETEQGKGALLQIAYTYNTLTPVGVPTIHFNRGAVLNVTYVDTVDEKQDNGFVNSVTTYYVPLDNLEVIDWECRYSFVSVNLSYDYVILEDLKDIVFNEIEAPEEELPKPEENEAEE